MTLCSLLTRHLGLIRSMASRVLAQESHWSPLASCKQCQVRLFIEGYNAHRNRNVGRYPQRTDLPRTLNIV